MSWSGGPSCSYGFQEEYTYDAQGRVWERIFTMVGYPGATPITLTSYFYYDAEGRLTVSQYPAATSLNSSATTTYTTDHDALGRPSDLYSGSPQQPTWLVSGATYNAAGQLTAMTTNAYTETLQYNANLQLTRIAAGGAQGIDFTYTYPTGNNGRISQMTDNISGEQVSYTYDQLNRLVQSVSTVTGTVPFAYDGFGNLTQQGQTTLSIDATTNRINSAGYQYNANGNVTQTPNPTTTYTYDVANRLVSNNAIYNPRNQRVFDETYIYLYTPEGKLAGKYTANWSTNGSVAFIQGGQPNVYFAGKQIQEGSNWVMTDRLGSVRLKGTERSSYLPYGAEVTQTSDQRTKFATYYRDSAGLDYAGQRYYGNGMGRFLTPDPGGARTADPKNPGSWNRYSYAGTDPVNFGDPTGRVSVSVPWDDLADQDDLIDDGGSGGWDGGSGGWGGCYSTEDGFVAVPDPACYVPVPVSTPAPTPNPKPDCNQILSGDINAYLGSYHNGASPLNTSANIQALVSAGMNYDVDPRFIVALSVAESGAGTNLTWGLEHWGSQSELQGTSQEATRLYELDPGDQRRYQLDRRTTVLWAWLDYNRHDIPRVSRRWISDGSW
jgi:RHS repeat-associated protein